MALFLSSKLRKAADTSLIEGKKSQLLNNYEEFVAFEQSEELQNYLELEREINSEDFKQNKKQIENKKFKGSDLEKREKKLKYLLKSKRYRVYASVHEGSELSAFEKTKESENLAKYLELQADVDSGKLNKKEGKEDWLLYKKLKSSSEIKAYFKFKDSKKHDIYRQVIASNLLLEIEDLKAELASEEFTTEKNFLLDKKRFEKTEAFNKLITYKELSESESFKKYFQFKKKNDFNLVTEWELTFSENFEGSELDNEKWITRYYWGDKFLNENYALPTDAHIFSEKNIKVSNSIARLETRKEKAQGKVWNPKIGFVQTEFDYTSALISTGKSFRQKYGLFEAKIKVNDIKNVMHSFWMLSDTSLPHIDIVKTNPSGKLFPGNISGSEDTPKVNYGKIKGLDWTKDFFIYSFEWTPTKLIWRINGVEVYTQTENIPHDPMYLILSSGVSNPNADVNAVMEIDWVKCYKRPE
ncbi:family 16 glycosylhydrolase [Ancylomarina sp. 16SWW S1-10-2]|uniref:glycoside hydrolase family 16 protein n=1 Tax=Ancylomarina sp. 16SWW S1-10-2 TaxID=2499681 RepID=UPI0012ADDD08|nr:glycoside hydrolase family 16 protein [Ancylomarina sp. 16SWW S1-10-2]MRT93898.1 glycosyl hydrolase family protein [Ancylomarina sp. 16SWW S1-10-2]